MGEQHDLAKRYDRCKPRRSVVENSGEPLTPEATQPEEASNETNGRERVKGNDFLGVEVFVGIVHGVSNEEPGEFESKVHEHVVERLALRLKPPKRSVYSVLEGAFWVLLPSRVILLLARAEWHLGIARLNPAVRLVVAPR